jgi:putative hydrolase of the HAD superfamily
MDEAPLSPPLDALVLDFGGVLYPIDYDAPVRAFDALGFVDFANFYHQASQNPLFDDLEVGAADPRAFLMALQSRCRPGTSLLDVEVAWNSILLRMPIERVQWVEDLGRRTQLYLFSNTNAIHSKEFERRMEADGLLHRFRAAFKAVHYSHELGRRKPHPQSFLALCADHGLKPERTGFVDDSHHHVVGARTAGLFGLHYHPDKDGSLPKALENAGWRFS